MNRLSNYQSKAPEFQKLTKGDHTVRLVSYKPTTSFHNYDGSLKSNLPAYSNPTEQLAITVVSVAGKGGLTHRLNMDGYVRTKELTPAELESGKFTDVDGYACAKDPASGKLVRLTDEARTATCEGILDQMFAAMGLPVGSGIDSLDAAIQEKKEFVVNVTREEFGPEGKEQLRIGSFKKAKVAEPVAAGIEA
jgi:hypothetical protein